MKRKVLRPTAVPTQFPLYSLYMQPAGSKKRRTLVRVPPNASTSHASGRSRQRKMQSPAERRQAVDECVAIEPCLQKEFEVEECQTSFNLTAIGFMEDAKKNAHRLQMQAKRLNERIKKLRQTCDEFQDRFKQGRLMCRTRSTLQVTCPECKL